MKNVSDNSCRQNGNTHFIFSIFFLCNYHADCAIMWGNDEEGGRAQMIIWCMCMACRITNATETYSLYVNLIAFPLKQWLHERPSTLCYTYTACWVLDFCSFRFNSIMVLKQIQFIPLTVVTGSQIKSQNCGSTV
jgi:hypothetical protein